jgi:(1->4)-alpha-D-glucan 1-alpha-D-glucosylmutase
MAGFARSLVEERDAPAGPLEYLFYQALVGAWPFGANISQLGDLEQRLADYLLKAAREAKTETSWLTPHAEYESAVQDFVHKLFHSQIFLEDVAHFCGELDAPAVVNALGQTVLKLCSPGVPDTYQGGELWNQSLVDPDNRQPVDYEIRRRCLSELQSQQLGQKALAGRLLETYADGRVKQYVLYSLLQLRKSSPELFAQGDYAALDGGEHVVAFMRSFEGQRLLCVVPRLSRALTVGRAKFPLGAVWGSRALSGIKPGTYRNVLTAERGSLAASTPLAQLLAELPVGVWLEEGA